MGGGMKVIIVQFEDGSYGIRRGWFSFKYLDLSPGSRFWWPLGSQWMHDCRCTDLQRVKTIYSHLFDPGKPLALEEGSE